MMLQLTPEVLPNGVIVFRPETNRFALTQAQKLNWMARECYVSIESTDYLEGELRGQFLHDATAYFVALLAGTNETSAVLTQAGGAVAMELNGNEFYYTGSFRNLASVVPNNTNELQVRVAGAGANGYLADSLQVELQPNLKNGIVHIADNRRLLTDGFIDTLMARDVYLNVYSTGQPQGEVRGQCLPMATSYLTATLAGINGTQPIPTAAQGGLKVEVIQDEIVVTGTFANLTGEFLSAMGAGSNLNLALPGEAGPLEVELNADVATDLKSGLWRARENVWTLDADQITALYNRDLYAQVHSTVFPAGEIRGQLVQEINRFPNAGADILLPLNNSTIVVDGLASTAFSTAWLASSDPDETNDVAYIWQVSNTTDFSNVLFQYNTANEKVFTTNHAVLEALLSDLGVEAGETVTLYHRVLVSDGSNYRVCNTSAVNFQRTTVGTHDVTSNGLQASVFPNPVSVGEVANLRIYAPENQKVKVSLLLVTGQEVSSEAVSLSSGTNYYRLPDENIASSVYFVRIQGSETDGQSLVIRVAKTR